MQTVGLQARQGEAQRFPKGQTACHSIMNDLGQPPVMWSVHWLR